MTRQQWVDEKQKRCMIQEKEGADENQGPSKKDITRGRTTWGQHSRIDEEVSIRQHTCHHSCSMSQSRVVTEHGSIRDDDRKHST